MTAPLPGCGKTRQKPGSPATVAFAVAGVKAGVPSKPAGGVLGQIKRGAK